MTTQTAYARGTYNEIKLDQISTELRTTVQQLIKAASESDRADEHGSWEFRAEFDGKGRGSAINYDVYAIGSDYHSQGLLVILQVRKYEKLHKNWFPSIRKNYFLLGYNEDGSAFAHAVSSPVIHAAIRAGRDPILAVQNWIFDADYTKVIRQGDLALVPVRSIPAPEIDSTELVLVDSHHLTADKIRQNGHLYAQNPTLYHLPGTHPTVSGRGWYRVQVGNRAEFWKFAAPSRD